MILPLVTLVALLGLVPDEATKNIWHPSPHGCSSPEWRTNLRRAGAALWEQVNTIIPFDSVPHNSRSVNLIGHKYGHLHVLGLSSRTVGETSLFWACKCVCGNVVHSATGNLRSGNTKSCGCLTREMLSNSKQTHGADCVGKRTPEYSCWAAMKTRCTNPRCDGWKNYGGRGIKVCERWIHSFENFLADMGKRPTLNHSIDRFPDNDGNYEPGNCRWATNREQMRNYSRNHLITFDGKTQTLTDWASDLGMKTATLIARVTVYGWTIERAFSQPVRHY